MCCHGAFLFVQTTVVKCENEFDVWLLHLLGSQARSYFSHLLSIQT